MRPLSAGFLLLLLTVTREAQAQPVCAASQFNGRAGVHVTRTQCSAIRGTLRPGDGSTFEEMQLDAVELDSSVGVTLRHNTIRATGQGYALRITGTQQRLRIEDNSIESQVTGTWHTVFIAHASAQDVVLSGNTVRNHGPGGEDLLQMIDWSGTWTVHGNTFGQNPAEDHVDIKYSTPGREARLLLTANTLEGGRVRAACILLHNASDRGIGGGYRYTVEVTHNTFQGCRVALYHRISTRQGEGDAGNRYLVFQRNTVHPPPGRTQSVVIESNNAIVTDNHMAPAQVKIGANGNHPSNVTVQNNTPPGATPPPPARPRPPVVPPQAPACNLSLAWEYPQLLHPQTSYELHVVTLVQGRPAAREQAVIPLPVDECPLALTPDGWQAVCTCVCLAEGDYSLSVRARREGQSSPYSNLLDLDFTAQVPCAPPVTIPMVPAPPPTKDPGPQPEDVAGPVVGGAVVVGGAGGGEWGRESEHSRTGE